MRKLIAHEWVTLDGVMQAPGDPGEDGDGGFEHGGWHLPYFDEVSQGWVVEAYEQAGGFVFGRRTYENLAGYWPHASEEEQVIAIPLNTKPKYVASSTLTEPLEWENSTLLEGDLAQAVTALKKEDGNDLHVVGSSLLLHSLLEHDLVDGFQFMIDPLLLGRGKRWFSGDGPRMPMRLVDSKVTSTGAILATYERTDA
jgi:dihydrofolate reductase